MGLYIISYRYFNHSKLTIIVRAWCRYLATLYYGIVIWILVVFVSFSKMTSVTNFQLFVKIHTNDINSFSPPSFLNTIFKLLFSNLVMKSSTDKLFFRDSCFLLLLGSDEIYLYSSNDIFSESGSIATDIEQGIFKRKTSSFSLWVTFNAKSMIYGQPSSYP